MCIFSTSTPSDSCITLFLVLWINQVLIYFHPAPLKKSIKSAKPFSVFGKLSAYLLEKWKWSFIITAEAAIFNHSLSLEWVNAPDSQVFQRENFSIKLELAISLADLVKKWYVLISDAVVNLNCTSVEKSCIYIFFISKCQSIKKHLW